MKIQFSSQQPPIHAVVGKTIVSIQNVSLKAKRCCARPCHIKEAAPSAKLADL